MRCVLVLVVRTLGVFNLACMQLVTAQAWLDCERQAALNNVKVGAYMARAFQTANQAWDCRPSRTRSGIVMMLCMHASAILSKPRRTWKPTLHHTVRPSAVVASRLALMLIIQRAEARHFRVQTRTPIWDAE
jgi:hypothetical protein